MPDVVPALLAVHPHPDDEAIACGGALARYADAGVATAVVTCTRGEEGGNWGGVDLGGRPLADVREDELAAALDVLGVRVHRYLGYRDSGMAGTAGNEHPESFHRADLDGAAARLAAIVRELRPTVVVSDDPLGTYGHPDHIKANRVTARAVALAADPAARIDGEPWTVARYVQHTLSRSRLLAVHRSMLSMGVPSPFGELDTDPEAIPFGTPDDEVDVRIDVRGWLDRKVAAIHAHASQLAPDSLFLNVPDELADAVFGLEEFRVVHGATIDRADDLFAGLTSGSPPSAG